MDNLNDFENKNLSTDDIDEVTHEPEMAEETYTEPNLFDDSIDLEDTQPVAEVISEPQPEPVVNEKPKADYTEPWREPTYTATSDNVRAYSPNRYSANTVNYGPRKKKKKKNSFAKAVGFIAAAAIVCGICGGGAAYLVTDAMLKNQDNGTYGHQVVLGATAENKGENNEKPQSMSVTGEELTGAQVYELACNQVVGVNTAVTTNVFGQQSSSAVSGSGFIISTDGHILTNYHVVEYADKYNYDLTVMLYDGTSHPAEIIGCEEDNDVAVIKIDAVGLNLNPVAFGSSEEMSVGETVYAIGNPLGELEFTMTTGSISALDRYVTTDANTSINMFQIDAAVNSGNSGGPVYNSRGEVIGIVTAKYSSTGVEGIGFAIPIDDAVNISTQLIKQGYVSGKAFLGVNVQDITETYSYYLNLPKGAYVYSFGDTNSCAALAGVKVGDVITAVGEHKITSTTDLKSALSHFSAGDTTTITVYRSGETLIFNVTFDEKAPETNTTQEQPQQQPQQQNPNDYYGGFGNGNGGFNDFWGFQIP